MPKGFSDNETHKIEAFPAGEGADQRMRREADEGYATPPLPSDNRPINPNLKPHNRITNKALSVLSAFLAENQQHENIGRELAFSADLCYNGANAKPLSEREGDRNSGGRSLRDFRFVQIFL